jgi:hypothetical protein
MVAIVRHLRANVNCPQTEIVYHLGGNWWSKLLLFQKNSDQAAD